MRKNVKKLASLILTMCIVLSLFALPFGNASAAETVQTVDVVLFSGQSNMDGIGKSTDAPVVIEPGTAYQYNPTAKTITNLNEAPLYYKEKTTAGAVGPVLA